ncbi:ubiquitin carboxyl-terminal hydrolase 8 [Phalaenopsis equestris]|uniref:ubiquitin carboxyl-terminal hydrolase 8 n=1 Tax=Phalaenopsis equestris TaxID=78828 RepID=UPI0009E34624|nr:ubiquitin carboxyl-terminal hydrolase 8 [Phalaenopsis equestris]
MDSLPPDDAGTTDQTPAFEDDRVYLVPYRWWAEVQELESEHGIGNVVRGIPYTASPAPSSYGGPMRIINNIFNSDLVFSLRRDDCLMTDDAEQGFSGRSYALIPTDMWSEALSWHRAANSGNLVFLEDESVDVYPLKLRISVIRETSVMTVRICKKDNAVESYKRACKIFSVESDMVRICDFSGQTNLILMNEWNRLPQDGQRLLDQENLLELQLYAQSELLSEGKKDDLLARQSKICCGGSVVSNGIIMQTEYDLYFGISKGYVSFGLTGLENLGNTCFMNSAIQCLAHTQSLVEYFLGDYSREINHQNSLGMGGELALAFGELLRKLWAPSKTPVVPRDFKAKLARFAPQFSGFNQHDSQELLAFLLDGLHEDLNRVKCKPYVEVKDSDDRPDEDVANEYWQNHLARNDSIIVDVCQGQYRSTLVCPFCNKVSVTFDPFMYLSLPLPSSTTRPMTVTVFSGDGSAQPSSYTVNVPKDGRCKDLIHALSCACFLRNDEVLLVAEVYANRIIRYLEDSSDVLTLIRDDDQLAAYRLPKDKEDLPLVVFTHQHEQERYIHSVLPPIWKVLGVPLIGRLIGPPSGVAIQNLCLKLLNPFLRFSAIASSVDEANESNSLDEVVEMDTNLASSIGVIDAEEARESTGALRDNFQFFLTDEKSQKMISLIEMNESELVAPLKKLHVLVCWQNKTIKGYEISLLSSLPEIYKCSIFTRRPHEPVSLYACLETFLKEEPLGPEDMWYCPSCKKHQQASKKLDLWRLPEVLVIHLKRFSYNRYTKNKLETLVDFPIKGLDLSNYIVSKTQELKNKYDLYAISNHYGNMGGGHYTAYVHHNAEDKWYDFDDRHVSHVSLDSLKTSAAYVLFYKRVQASSSETQSTQ